MIRNPEFRRNLWLEMTPYRLIGMPLVLGIVFFLAYLLDDNHLGDGVAATALTFFGGLAFLWGTRMSSESVVGEIRDHTWDGQRMSVLGPWSMTWGKLLGSTIYPWYGALLCLVVYALAAPIESPLQVAMIVLLMLALGLFSQAIGLLASLQAIRKNRVYGRSQAAGFLILGIGAAMPVLSLAFGELDSLVYYGYRTASFNFILGSLLIFLGWSIVGVNRLMRAELQLKSTPWVWLCFACFLMVYCSGFVEPEAAYRNELATLPTRLLVAFHVAVGMIYFMAFSEKKDPVAFRRLMQAVREKSWAQALESLPCWMSTLPLALMFGLLLTAIAMSALLKGASPGQFIGYAPAVILFLCRDLGLLLYLNLGRTPKRADMLTILYLGLLYGIIPAIIQALDFELLTGLFWPRFDQGPLLILVAGLCEASIIWWFLIRRWRSSKAN